MYIGRADKQQDFTKLPKDVLRSLLGARASCLSPAVLGEEEIGEVVDTVHSDWITTGPKVRRLQEELAAFIGAPTALALNSCAWPWPPWAPALGAPPSLPQ